jgi:hypothetical protein
VDWYKVADTKAQLLVTLDGIFITVLATTMFAKPDELQPRLDAAGPVGLAFVALSAVTMTLSITCALGCLYSRISAAKLRRLTTGDLHVDPGNPSTYHEGIAGWFGYIASIAQTDLAPNTARPFVVRYLRRIGITIDRLIGEHGLAVRGGLPSVHRQERGTLSYR